MSGRLRVGRSRPAAKELWQQFLGGARILKELWHALEAQFPCCRQPTVRVSPEGGCRFHGSRTRALSVTLDSSRFGHSRAMASDVDITGEGPPVAGPFSSPTATHLPAVNGAVLEARPSSATELEVADQALLRLFRGNNINMKEYSRLAAYARIDHECFARVAYAVQIDHHPCIRLEYDDELLCTPRRVPQRQGSGTTIEKK